MKKYFLSLLVLLVAAVGTQAKSWKIGPSSVTGMDFASINAAMSSSNVSAGDTLYLDQYYNENQEQNVTKRVVIIGTGYDTSLTDEQVVATLTNNLYLKANDIVVKSVKLVNVYFYNSDCIIERCFANLIQTKTTTAGMNHIYSCYIMGSVYGYGDSNYSMMDIQNNVFYLNWNHNGDFVWAVNSSIINNNVFLRTVGHYNGADRWGMNRVTNTQITNNILLYTGGSGDYNYCMNSSVYSSGSGNSIEHNILSLTNAIANFPNNKVGYGASVSELFTQQGNYSDYFKLADSSPAKGYATDGGDCGCHGGMFGCPSGGRPQYIPYFSKVVVGSRTENGKLPVSVTVKIQDE